MSKDKKPPKLNDLQRAAKAVQATGESFARMQEIERCGDKSHYESLVASVNPDGKVDIGAASKAVAGYYDAVKATREEKPTKKPTDTIPAADKGTDAS